MCGRCVALVARTHLLTICRSSAGVTPTNLDSATPAAEVTRAGEDDCSGGTCSDNGC